MTTEKILELVEDYFKMEYRDIQHVAERHRILNATEYLKFYVNAVLQRCLGVTLFVQSMDISYDDINKLYNNYKEKIEKVLDNT